MLRNAIKLVTLGIYTYVAFGLAGCGNDGNGNSIVDPKTQEKTILLPTTVAITDTSTKAKVFLGTDDRFTISNSGATIYGGQGYDTVTIASTAKNVVLNQAIDQINIPDATTDYTFTQSGVVLSMNGKNAETIFSTTVQYDSDGTILSFSDALISASLSTSGKINLVKALNPQVTIVTSKGTIVVELYLAQAPITVRNFLTYVKEGFYTNTLFHRVITGFVVQGGGFTTSGVIKPTTHSPITMEAPTATGLTNALGTIAMARSSDLNSATSQFFFNLVDNNSALNGPYAVFGSVISGMDVVQQIGATSTSDQTLVADKAVIISMTQTQ